MYECIFILGVWNSNLLIDIQSIVLGTLFFVFLLRVFFLFFFIFYSFLISKNKFFLPTLLERFTKLRPQISDYKSANLNGNSFFHSPLSHKEKDGVLVTDKRFLNGLLGRSLYFFARSTRSLAHVIPLTRSTVLCFATPFPFTSQLNHSGHPLKRQGIRQNIETKTQR